MPRANTRLTQTHETSSTVNEVRQLVKGSKGEEIKPDKEDAECRWMLECS